MTGPRLSYEDFQREVDLSPEAFEAEDRPGGKPRGFRTKAQIDRLNKADKDQARDDIADAERTTRGKVLGTFAVPLSEVPGGKVLQALYAGAGEGGYREGLENVEGAIASAPAAARIPAKILGGVAAGGGIAGGAARAVPLLAKGSALAKAASALSGSAALQGATYGGASGLLDANADVGVGQRLLQGAGGAAIGAAAGKAGELIGTKLRSMGAKPLSENLNTRTAKRAEIAEPHYKAFRNLGDLKGPPELDDILALPIVERAAKAVQGESPTLAKLPMTDAKVLDAIYKRVGDKAFAAKHGYEPAEALDALGSAMESGARAKGGSYTAATEAFKKHSRLIEGVKRGREATRFGASPAGTPMTKSATWSPEAFADWAKTATAAEKEAAVEGILAMVKQGPTFARLGTLKGSVPVVGMPSRTLRSAAARMREMGAEKPSFQKLIEALAVGSTPTP